MWFLRDARRSPGARIFLFGWCATSGWTHLPGGQCILANKKNNNIMTSKLHNHVKNNDSKKTTTPKNSNNKARVNHTQGRNRQIKHKQPATMIRRMPTAEIPNFSFRRSLRGCFTEPCCCCRCCVCSVYVGCVWKGQADMMGPLSQSRCTIAGENTKLLKPEARTGSETTVCQTTPWDRRNTEAGFIRSRSPKHSGIQS